MSDVVIRADNLGKRYRLGKRQRYKTLRESITSAFHRRSDPAKLPISDDHIWALKGVSFEVKQGEVIGVIGRNGAGKSTLLKILSRITEPTEGCAEIEGRVGSLLEVGTGFHPELTGRENIYLNGAILGMRKAEIERQFEEIIAFAEIEKFIETPVKHYSSGMYVRLAFAVAAHLETEILLVDEVLAVGDAEFQRKCLGKMQDVTTRGRTILFVSHNMGAIAKLCGRCLLLDRGCLIDQGATRSVIDTYLAKGMISEEAETDYEPDPSKPVQIRRVRLLDNSQRLSVELDRTRPFCVNTLVQAHRAASNVNFTFSLETIDGTRICDSISADQLPRDVTLVAGETYQAVVEFPGNLLRPGSYRFRISVGSLQSAFDERWPLSFRINDVDGSTSSRILGTYAGLLQIPLQWQVQRV